MLDACRALLGTAEDPPGSNHNFITDWYGWDDAWCDMAVSYAGAQSDNADVVGKFAWTPSHAMWFKNHGLWHYGLSGARPGDVVFFDWSGSRLITNIDHVGVIEAVHSDGTITTLEGNTLDVYARRQRNGAVVVGWGRPAYIDAAPMPGADGILRQGATGDAVRTLQTSLNTVLGTRIDVDGEYGPATAAAVRGLQGVYRLAVDGEYGPASAAALRAALAGATAPIQPVPVAYTTPAPAAALAVDGQLGPHTYQALQRYLNARGAHLDVDGEFGPETKRALQRQLGVAVDGIIGRATVRALQSWVGAAVDGQWGPNTSRRLQITLNAAGG
jgi:peptidoglycan hydrolase-like protein with peptidoglycan-binding domain